MVSGHLHEKNGYFYIILNLTDMSGKRKPKWIATGLPVKGNKKRAEKLLIEARKQYDPVIRPQEILFADYLEQWLEVAKSTVSIVTYSSYSNQVKGVIAPYFRKKQITLEALRAKDIQDFYQDQLQRVSASTVIHYHANIHKALKHAVKMDMIATNPADKVERPQKEKFQGGFYTNDELDKLFEGAAGSRLELAIMFGAFYGLRRSEIVGLKWDAIDFDKNTFTIRHTVTSCNIDGKSVVVARDTTKNKTSRRTLPLVATFREKLLKLKEEQAYNRKLCGRSYNTDYLDYIYVNEIGERIKPGYITTQFPIFLERHGFRRIRFHDLRHSCASLLLANGVPMKMIQEWLGHSDFSTTANFYSHLEYSAKEQSAQTMENALHFPNMA